MSRFDSASETQERNRAGIPERVSEREGENREPRGPGSSHHIASCRGHGEGNARSERRTRSSRALLPAETKDFLLHETPSSAGANNPESIGPDYSFSGVHRVNRGYRSIRRRGSPIGPHVRLPGSQRYGRSSPLASSCMSFEP
ncbi:Hypothetical protein NTJ_07833 [Nesidiocoris tenuis]|uniref:Uncharacterized protein n=1 Tax=Nesidiocoris tenuis TaxID=355587 RepID=A0ABN7AUN6_9HEMI|nr:Hypothetical protein NTJ_07833 [Nesidiocoris tenuis]